MKRIILFCTLILIATSSLAAKPEKTLICHVGNEVGPGGETYLDDPYCAPNDLNNYFCPSAGKIDLVFVPDHVAAKHLNNPNHVWDGVSDYDPIAAGASGVGSEDTDENGVDDGCEPVEDCPCSSSEAWSLASQETYNVCHDGPISDSSYGGGNQTVMWGWGPPNDEFHIAAGWSEHSQTFYCNAGRWTTDPVITHYYIWREINQVEASHCRDQMRQLASDKGMECAAIY